MKKFKDKVAVITGAGSGLGRSLAVQLAKSGARLALCDLNKQTLKETAQLTECDDDRISLHSVDVSNHEQMLEFAEEVIECHGQTDLLFNNAGIALTPARFEDITFEQFTNVMNINMWGVFNGIQAFLPQLKSRPEAYIVNIASLAGLVGLYGYTPYSMSKFAVRGLSEALQSELSGTNTGLLIVYPGGIKTNIIKNAPNLEEDQRNAAHDSFSKAALLTPDKAAAKILAAVQKKKNHIILGGDAKAMKTLHSVFPRSFPKIANVIFSKAMFADD